MLKESFCVGKISSITSPPCRILSAVVALKTLLARFDYSKLSTLMGGRNSTVYLTIMRDPVDIFVSEWFYYRLDGRYSMSLGQH